MKAENMQIFMLIFGCFFLVTGFIVRIGFWKDWYWKGLKLVYGYIPMGLLFIFWFFKPQVSKIISSELIGYQLPTVLMLIFSAWFSARTPKFMKPGWVNWVELNPKRVIDGMVAEVKAGEEWVDKVKSKEAVDSWARKIKNKLPKRK